MRIPMLTKARKIFNFGDVTKNSINPDSEYWDVFDYETRKTHQITFKRIFPKNSKIPYYIWGCDCTINALQPKDHPICAHKVAFLIKRFYEPQFVVDYGGKEK